ncbi:MAG: hypothetical protein RR319_04355, partial [Bacteroides sp.]
MYLLKKDVETRHPFFCFDYSLLVVIHYGSVIILNYPPDFTARGKVVYLSTKRHGWKYNWTITGINVRFYACLFFALCIFI